MDISMLNNEQYKLYREAENQVSDEHPYKCVCGRGDLIDKYKSITKSKTITLKSLKD